MSKQQARMALDQLVGRPSLISQAYAAATLGVSSEVTSGALFADLRELSDAVLSDEVAATGERMRLMVSAYGYDVVDANDKPFVFANGYAIIPVHGLLINRFSYSWSCATGYNFIRNQIMAARADNDVTALIFDVNTYGGTVAGCQETADLIFEGNGANGGKPCIAVVDANCQSAGYFLTSQCDHVAVTPSGSVGSIGVLRVHFDMSKMMDDMGVKVSFIVAGDHKVDGNPYEPLSDEVRAEFQADIDDCYDVFVATVVRGRGLADEAVRETQARTFSAADALALGLVDTIQNPADAVEAYFCTEDDSDDDDGAGDDPDAQPEDPQENNDMAVRPVTTPTKPGAAAAAPVVETPEVTSENTAQATADARLAERTRIQGIQGHAEAVGREAVAQHLALNTDLDVDTAVGILAATPKATAVAAPAATAADPAKAEETNHFATAMNADKHPNVGSTGGGTEAAGDKTPAQRMLAAQMRASGPTRREVARA